MKKLLVPALGVLAFAGLAPAAPVKDKQSLTLAGARTAVQAIAAEAARNGVGGAVAVVDDGGNLVLVERLEGTFPAGVAVAIEKAKTAAMFQRPTRVFEDAIRNGRTSLVAVDVMTPLQGGVPIVVNGQTVGAVGVSGAASAQQDDDFADIGAAAAAAGFALAQASDRPVTFLASADVKEGFRKGAVLVDAGNYMVHASHRDGPGQAEVHSEDTDIIYVLCGTAEFVTGGRVDEAGEVGPGEIRGRAITGGEARKLAPGDVMIVPNGVPHWFRSIDGPFDYYVVKVRRPEGSPS